MTDTDTLTVVRHTASEDDPWVSLGLHPHLIMRGIVFTDRARPLHVDEQITNFAFVLVEKSEFVTAPLSVCSTYALARREQQKYIDELDLSMIIALIPSVTE